MRTIMENFLGFGISRRSLRKQRRMKRRRKRELPRRTMQSVTKIDSEIVSEEHPTMYFSSGNLIESNKDLLRNILIHIPHKPISTFKSVSKFWLKVISDPDFSIIWHTKHIPSPCGLLFHNFLAYRFILLNKREKNPYGHKFNFDFDFDLNSLSFFPCICHSIKVLQSCNGLLLLSINSDYNIYHSEVRIGVYNPTTNQLKLTPKFPKKYSYDHFSNKSKLAFDPSKWRHYKVFSVVQADTGCSAFLIYSSETDSWRVPAYEGYDIPKYSTNFSLGVYWNGAINWPMAIERFSLSFDINKECCLRTPMPHKRTITRYFGESGGHLYLIEYKKDFTLRFDILEMENDYSKWFVKYCVDFTFLGLQINPQNWVDQRFRILSVIVNGDEVALVMHALTEDMVMSYNLKNQKLKKLCPLSRTWWMENANWSAYYQYIRSPVRL